MNDETCPHCFHSIAASESADSTRRCPHCRQRIDDEPTKPRVAKRRSLRTQDEPEAKLSRGGNKIDFEELVDMTAMVDIVFFLLIFFLVTSMVTVQSSARLPTPDPSAEGDASRGAATEASRADTHDLVITIQEDDVIQIDGARYSDKADIALRIRSTLATANRDAVVLIVGHANASHGALADVLDTVSEVGVSKLQIAVTE